MGFQGLECKGDSATTTITQHYSIASIKKGKGTKVGLQELQKDHIDLCKVYIEI